MRHLTTPLASKRPAHVLLGHSLVSEKTTPRGAGRGYEAATELADERNSCHPDTKSQRTSFRTVVSTRRGHAGRVRAARPFHARRVLVAGLLAMCALLPVGAAAHAAEPAPPAPLNLPAQPRVLLIGDSYTQGVGAVPESEGYAYKIAEPLGWTLTIDGFGGSGYANPTTYGAGIFASRLWKHPADAYDLVVLQGSSNDAKYTDSVLAGDINMTLRTVQRRYPHAKVLMMGVTNPYGSPSPDLQRIDGKLKSYAAMYGVPFIDPLAEQWFVPGGGKIYANPTNYHPSNAGHQLMADRFVTDVKAM